MTFLKIFAIGIFLSIAIPTVKATAIYFRIFLRGKIKEENTEIIVNIYYYFTIITVSLFILYLFHFRLDSLWIAGGVIGLGIGIACQKMTFNYVAGLYLIIKRPIKTGDHVKIAGNQGIVKDIQTSVMKLQTVDGQEISIENEKIFRILMTHLDFEHVFRIQHIEDTEKALWIINENIEEYPLIIVTRETKNIDKKIVDSPVLITLKVGAKGDEWFRLKKNFLHINTTLKKEGF